MEDKNTHYQFPLIIYDAHCPMCKRFKMALEKYDADKVLRFVSLYDDQLYQDFAILDPEECFETIHCLVSEEKVLKGGEAIHYIAGFVPKVHDFKWLLDNEATKKAVGAFYNSLNAVRKSISRPKGCCQKKL